MEKSLYCFRQSWGIASNLQLHSLRLAYELWANLQVRRNVPTNSGRSALRPARITERCVVIVDLLGLSLSQLLGQNFFSGIDNKVPGPRHLWTSFLGVAEFPNKKDINCKFRQLMNFYDDCRHFGIPKHCKINELSFELTGEFVKLALDIWDLVCDHFNSKNPGAISVSIRDILKENENDVDEWERIE